MSDDDSFHRTEAELDRRFQGRAVLDQLLTEAGSLADTEDVAGAFSAAVREGVPPAVVIDALWEDEPRFASPQVARTLFGNLLGLYELVASGAAIDLKGGQAPARREKAPRPVPFGAEGPDDAFVEAAWRYLEDHPKERARLFHGFDHRQDELVTWLEAEGLEDEAFGLTLSLLRELDAMLALAGGHCLPVRAPPSTAASLPSALVDWVDEWVAEAEAHEEAPLPPPLAARVRDLVRSAGSALWSNFRPST